MTEILKSLLLERIGWLDHGFGTRGSNLIQDSMVSLDQIHSAKVLVADSTHGCAGSADALVTNRPGITLSVRSADCFPVLLVDGKIRAVAAVHAGWRGTADRIVLEALKRMAVEFGTSVEDVYAAIGPGIGACCYAVGEDVARKFGFDRAGHINLGQINRDQMIAAGVLPERIDAVGGCTFCDRAQFHSYRRDKDAAGRMISFVSLRPETPRARDNK